MFSILLSAGEQGEQELDRASEGSDWRQGDESKGTGRDPKHNNQYDAGDEEEENRMRRGCGADACL